MASRRLGGKLAGLHVVGGDLWVTLVQRSGTTIGIVHSWPDEVGHPIRPEVLDEGLLPPIAPHEAEVAGYTFAEWMQASNAGEFEPETFKPRKTGGSRRERRAAEARS